MCKDYLNRYLAGIEEAMQTVYKTAGWAHNPTRDAIAAAIRALSSPPPDNKEAVATPKHADNQCDGCNAGMPIEGGIHQSSKGENHMSCSAGKYTSPPPDAAHDVDVWCKWRKVLGGWQTACGYVLSADDKLTVCRHCHRRIVVK